MKAITRDGQEMKYSGIEWIGEVPSTWRVCKTLYGLSMPITDGPHTTPELYAEGVPFVSAEAVSTGNGSIDFSHIRGYVSEEFYQECSKKYIPQREDIYMIKSGATTGKVSIVDTDRKFTIWSPLAVFRVNNERIISKYLFYYIQSEAYQKQVELNWSYGTQQNIGMRVLEQLKICMPVLDEQKNIANYLDDRCSKIDAIIAEAKASIEEYKELKQAVIYEAVTKGLDKNVEMKDSGVEWIGQIPKNWSSVRFSKVNWIRARLGWKGLKADEYVDEGYPFLSAFNIQNNKLIWENINHITIERYEESPEIKLQEKDILLVKDGAGIGKCARIDKLPLGESTVNSSLAVITSNELMNYKYEYFYLLSPIFQNVITRLKNGMGVPHLTQEAMKEIVIPCPPIEEQTIIADYLDDKMSKIDLVIATKQSLIEDLEYYKKSLIYEVVTGKRKVVE